jgi:hypothetical protein
LLVIPIANNQTENKQVRDIVVRLGLSKDQAQQLHREISGMGYNYHEILQSLKTCSANKMIVTTPMQQIQELVRPLIGHLVWNIRGGHGSFLTLEFGNPHLTIREPKVPSPERDAKVRRALGRRRVFVVGDWSLFIQYCDWKISVGDSSIDSQSIGVSTDECLLDLEGQRFVSLEGADLPNSWKFQFNLGGKFEIWPSAAYQPTDDLWSLRTWNGDVAALQTDGRITFEKAARDGVKPSTRA